MGSGKASLVTGLGAMVVLIGLAALAGLVAALDVGAWAFGAIGFVAMLCWGAHIVGIGFAVQALRATRADRRAGYAGLALNAGSLAVWLALVPWALG